MNDLIFAKIVATPTLHAWSQAYHAGKLFAVLSINKENINEEEELLPPLGKEIISTLEEEYFTLEEKNLETIKEAIKTTSKKMPQDVHVSFVIASIINDLMYVFVINKGKVLIKRGDKIGTILESQKNNKDKKEYEIAAASGRLKHNDVVILETDSFANLISTETLNASIDNHTPTEIAETLSPSVHEKEEGGATAIIIRSLKPETTIDDLPFNETEKEEKKKKPLTLPLSFTSLLEKFSQVKKPWTHSKKMFISIAAILAIVFLASIFFALKKQEEAKTKALFQETITKAQKKYEEGTALITLNKQLAKEDLLEAKKIIEKAQPKFTKSSNENKQLQTLNKRIEEAITTAQALSLIQPKEVDENQSPMLSYVKKRISEDIWVTQNTKSIYVLDKNGVISVDKATDKTKKVITNKEYWNAPKSVGLYLSNIYVLDALENQIRKFVPASQGYQKTNYIKSDVQVDLTNAASMAVDTSIWILIQNGEITKFTRGRIDAFSFSGLEQPLSNPTRIFTDTETTNLYILDNGNGRIVVFNKEGLYQAQYQTDIIKDAKEFEVLEKQKKIYILSKDKIWEIPLK